MSIKALLKRDVAAEERAKLLDQVKRGQISNDEYRSLISKFAEHEYVWYTNPAKEFVKPAWFIPDNKVLLPLTPWLITLAPGGTSGQIPIEFDEGTGHGEIAYIMSEHTGAYTINIYDGGRRYYWANREIHIDTIAGVGQRPLIAPLAYFVPVKRGSRQLTVQMTDISGAPNTIRFMLGGRRWLHRQAPRDVLKVFEDRYDQMDRSLLYLATTKDPITALGAGLATDFEVQAPSDAPLELIKSTAVTDPAGTPFDIELKEWGSGRAFSADNLRISGAEMFGTPQYPHIPYESFFLPPNFKLVGTIWNRGALPADFYLTWIGAKLMHPET